MMAGAPAAVSSNVIAMVVAIDGPAGAGKSTVARAAAERLGFTYLDSGAMYRAVALAAARRDDADLAAVAEAADIRLGERVLLDGEDVTEAIRSPEVTERSSRVSTHPAVRAALVRKQRALLDEGDWVAEGRDIGTVVRPDAEVKVFLTARPEVRARRRADQFGEDYETVLADIAARDRRDMEREHSPLTPAADAVPVDTSDLDLDGVLEQIATLVVEAREIAP
jgi:cytidylate kinase